MRRPRSLRIWGSCVFSAGLLVLVSVTFAGASECASPAKAPKRITMDLKGVEIGRVLQIIEEASGLNFVVGSEVRGRVTVHITDTPWPRALESVLRANGYDSIQQGTIIRIDRAETLRKERELRLRRPDC
ncbi:MAG: hypothetical protein ACE5IQ_05155 [Candidatus Methylomirabilales bacterium]